jgi:hypothetical protein
MMASLFEAYGQFIEAFCLNGIRNLELVKTPSFDPKQQQKLHD